jgi:hypothetical protein
MSGEAGWCILRTGGSRTLPLARSLAQAGYEVWTPIQEHDKRRSRSKVRVSYSAPIMPTFVFARARHLPYLSDPQAMNAHPKFAIFHYCGKIPIIADKDIADLRQFEERAKRDTILAKRKAAPRVYSPSTPVRMDEGSFAGMTGIVKSGDDKYSLVSFGGSFEVKIATFLLSEEGVHEPQPERGSAALAA